MNAELELIDTKKKNLTPETKNRTRLLYEWLKENAVGYDNRKTEKDIIAALPEFKKRQMLEESIKILRLSVNRKIGSLSGGGYWLACRDDKVTWDHYIISQILSKMEVAVKTGVDVNVFYKKLNEIKDSQNKIVDQQQLLFEGNEGFEIRRYSDDLKG